MKTSFAFQRCDSAETQLHLCEHTTTQPLFTTPRNKRITTQEFDINVLNYII